MILYQVPKKSLNNYSRWVSVQTIKIGHDETIHSHLPNTTQVNRMCRSRRVLATGGKQTEYGWTGSVLIHFYFL